MSAPPTVETCYTRALCDQNTMTVKAHPRTGTLTSGGTRSRARNRDFLHAAQSHMRSYAHAISKACAAWAGRGLITKMSPEREASLLEKWKVFGPVIDEEAASIWGDGESTTFQLLS